MTAPYENQGKPLSPSVGAKGEWIWENRFFLCRPEDGDWTFSSRVHCIKAPTGNNCFGFKADDIALALGVDMDQLFELNRQCKLSIKGRPVPSVNVATPIRVEFTFTIPSAACELTVDGTYHTGTA